MKLNKLFLIGAIALGLVACSTNEIPEEVSNNATNSYASVTVKFPKGATFKALPGDYNEKGAWTGRDVIETVTVFLVNTAKGVVDYNSFSKSSFAEIDAATGVLKPNLALKATAGENIRVYTVINGEAGILATLKATSAANFAGVFAGEAEKMASDVAKYNAGGTETIMMTNDADNYTIAVAAGATEAEALAGTKNHVQVSVERVVSRAMLTVEPATGGNWTVKAKIAGVETDIATVTGVTYAVAQSNKKFYIMKKADYSTPDPAYTYIPTAADWATNTYFDYSGLASFSAAQEFTYDATKVSEKLASEQTSKFVLPVNHVVTETNLLTARDAYKKGNTTYFEIRATFVPLAIDGTAYTGEAKTVYLGANDNKFYSTRALAEAQGQKATEFKNGVMKYVLWLNPNSLVATVAEPNPMVSPTVRNQIYHAHIDAFLRMGVPNNPLDPNDPNDPLNPENPIDPTDPLKTDFTYLSVSVKVLPWTIHSYKLSLTGDSMY